MKRKGIAFLVLLVGGLAASEISEIAGMKGWGTVIYFIGLLTGAVTLVLLSLSTGEKHGED